MASKTTYIITGEFNEWNKPLFDEQHLEGRTEEQRDHAFSVATVLVDTTAGLWKGLAQHLGHANTYIDGTTPDQAATFKDVTDHAATFTGGATGDRAADKVYWNTRGKVIDQEGDLLEHLKFEHLNMLPTAAELAARGVEVGYLATEATDNPQERARSLETALARSDRDTVVIVDDSVADHLDNGYRIKIGFEETGHCAGKIVLSGRLPAELQPLVEATMADVTRSFPEIMQVWGARAEDFRARHEIQYENL